MRRSVIAGLMAGFVLAGAALAQDAPAPDAATVVATINGTEITLGHLIALRARMPAQYQELPDAALYNILLEQMVDQTLLADSLSSDPGQDPLAVRVQLENERRQALAMQALNARMADAVDEAQVQAEYDRQYGAAAGGLEYNAAHILVETEEKALALKAEIDGGADFAELARANSTDTGSGAQGGDLGWFGTGRMVPEFEAAVVATAPGEIAGPVKTQFGWHLIRVNESRTPVAPPLEQVRPQILEALRQQALQATLTKMREGAEINLSVTKVDPAAIRDSALLAE